MEGLSQTDRLATRLVPRLPKLKRVIIQIYYPSLFYDLAGTTEGRREFDYLQEWSVPPEHFKDWLDCRLWCHLARENPGVYLKLLAQYARGWLENERFDYHLDQEVDSRGWLANVTPAPPDLNLARGKARVAYQNGWMKAGNEADNLAHLDHLLSMFRQRNIEVVFVTVPVWHTYIEGIKPAYWKETQRVMAQRTNNSSVFYYSFLDTPQLEPQDYVDVEHLSPHGAVRLTQMLTSAMNQGKQRSEAKTNSISTNMTR